MAISFFRGKSLQIWKLLTLTSLHRNTWVSSKRFDNSYNVYLIAGYIKLEVVFLDLEYFELVIVYYVSFESEYLSTSCIELLAYECIVDYLANCSSSKLEQFL